MPVLSPQGRVLRDGRRETTAAGLVLVERVSQTLPAYHRDVTSQTATTEAIAQSTQVRSVATVFHTAM